MRGTIRYTFQVVSGDGSSLIRPTRSRRSRRRWRAVAVSARRIWSATPPEFLADRWPTDALPPFRVDAQPAPEYRLGGVVGGRLLIRIPRRPGRIICARPTPSFPRIGCRKPRSLKRHDQPCDELAVWSVARRRGGG